MCVTRIPVYSRNAPFYPINPLPSIYSRPSVLPCLRGINNRNAASTFVILPIMAPVHPCFRALSGSLHAPMPCPSKVCARLRPSRYLSPDYHYTSTQGSRLPGLTSYGQIKIGISTPTLPLFTFHNYFTSSAIFYTSGAGITLLPNLNLPGPRPELLVEVRHRDTQSRTRLRWYPRPYRRLEKSL